MCFLTGCERTPFGGYTEKIKVYFKHDCKASCKCYPTVSVCGMSLILPIHLGENLKTLMIEAIKLSPGFGRI